MSNPVKYNVIVKLNNKDFGKWIVTNLLKFTAFLDLKHPDWRYMNVFNFYTRDKIRSFTKNNRPIDKHC